jgi:hypothetical protein
LYKDFYCFPKEFVEVIIIVIVVVYVVEVLEAYHSVYAPVNFQLNEYNREESFQMIGVSMVLSI